jgi:glycopeptide antibiotics resistance protein
MYVILQVIDDWQYVSLILDRLLFIVYLIVTVAATLSILMFAPHIFSSFDQQAFKKSTQNERYCYENSPDGFDDCMRERHG